MQGFELRTARAVAGEPNQHLVFLEEKIGGS
jgi:hypothetical protein